MRLSPLLTFTLATLVAHASAQGSGSALTPPIPDLCVDPVGYQTCDGNTHSLFATCSSGCGPAANTTCIAGCDRLLSGSTLACWWTHCWNQLASCYVQDEVLVYLTSSIIKEVGAQPQFPFYPPQDGSGGACQCNIGKLGELWQLANATQDPCPKGSDCSCCWNSALASAYYDICPNGNPYLAGYQYVATNASAALLASPNSCSILRASNNPSQGCAKYGTPPFGAKEYLDIQALPSGFLTGSMTNNPGSVTALATPSGSVTVLSLPDFTTTVTYAPFTSISINQGASGGTPTLSPETAFTERVSWTFGPSGGGSAAATGGSGGATTTAGGGSASGTGAAPAATSSKSAASGGKSDLGMGLGVGLSCFVVGMGAVVGAIIVL